MPVVVVVVVVVLAMSAVLTAGLEDAAGGERGAAGLEDAPGGERGAAGLEDLTGGERGAAGLEDAPGGERGAAGLEDAAGGERGAARLEDAAGGERAAGRPGCPARCRCEEDGVLHRVDCADLGLSEVPARLSVFTAYLMLQNNQLRSVPDEAFQNLPNLQSLRLDANHISSVPIGCFSGLHALRHLWLDDNSLTEVPVSALSDLPALQAMTLALNHISQIPDHAFANLSSLVVLHLNNNRIVSMGSSCFYGLHSLETLDLNYNSLVEFPVAIRALSHLKELGFHSNSIRSIPEHAFTGNPSLLTIFFYDNPIQSVGRSAFQNLPELRTLSLNGAADITEFPDLTGTSSLESLTITGARITSLPGSVCEQLPNLQLLDLSYNRIWTLPSLSRCLGLQKIDLRHNEIEDLAENTFHGLLSLCSLDLSWNKLSSLAPHTFSGLPALLKLDLSSNQLSTLPLIGLNSLSHLRLAGNTHLMETIPRERLPRVRVMELPYAFQCCAFISCERGGAPGSSWERQEAPRGHDSTRSHALLSFHDQEWEEFLMESEDEPKSHYTVQCSPAPGPLRPCLHLFGSWLIRGGVWLIAVLSLASNGLVMLSIFLSPTSWLTPTKLLIGLLALVNGLMGVWSSWLAAVDGWTFGGFWRYGVGWENSFLCHLSGFLCVFSSQTSLFLLTLAVLERSLAAPRHHRKKHRDTVHSSQTVTMRLSVFLCFLLGLAVTLPHLLAEHGATALCLPLPSSSLAFCISLVLLDSLCFLLMTAAYARLYCHAEKGSTPHREEEEEEEAVLTRHVAWLLFSDCVLYLLVAFLLFSSPLRLPAGGPDILKGVLLLLVPLPACVNPLLYLLFTPLARDALIKRPCKLPVGAGRAGPVPAALDSLCDEDAEKQSCDSTQALVTVGHDEEEEWRRRGEGIEDEWRRREGGVEEEWRRGEKRRPD
ncbi:leucine-rich repeat-containing G-protein coupled receptor 5-like [Lampris incognitus]|uniref:leucine-rich repeat-containing G-protein coupled receptor 5-like n=1 Tax=Lampris incognitus TaxID=2546036 RepID=UPI0024B5C045|nr:leucine-rich repeat-containing G-protein coupled receptor 5-like [Lampris incognitus]